MKEIKRIILIAFLMICTKAVAVDITSLGAIGDGITDNTEILQSAIDSCFAIGGGEITIPSGEYLIRPVRIKSNITLHIEAGAVLKGSTNLEDYKDAFPYPGGTFNQSCALIWARDAENIAVVGRGTIHGQGEHENFQLGNDGPGKPFRPKIIYFARCSNVTVQDITLRNSAYWVQHYEECEHVFIRGEKVYSHCNFNNDGIDIDSRDVIVCDCVFDNEDDAICLKSDHAHPCENIVISNCIAASNCNGVKFGTSSIGGYRNISISNLVIHGAEEDNIRHWQERLRHITAPKTVISGLAIEMVDGGQIDGVSVSNVTMKDVQTPIVVRLGGRFRRNGVPQNGETCLQNVSICNVTAICESFMSSSITACNGLKVRNVSLDNMVLSHPGGGTEEMADIVLPDVPKAYPENRMFGDTYPCCGFFVRNVEGLTLSNIRIISREPDCRPAFRLECVRDCDIKSCHNTSSAGKLISKDKHCKDIHIF